MENLHPFLETKILQRPGHKKTSDSRKHRPRYQNDFGHTTTKLHEIRKEENPLSAKPDAFGVERHIAQHEKMLASDPERLTPDFLYKLIRK